MARKKVSQAANTSTSTTSGQEEDVSESTPATLPETITTPLDPVKVNNANLTELKLACDDAVRRYFSRPDQFKTRNTHTDVKLVLGWSSVIVAAATGYYGWKNEFEQAKPAVWIGLILYLVLTGIQTAYTYYVEGNTVFVGKRKTLAKRIETERITVSSKTLPAPAPSQSPQYLLTMNYIRSSNRGKTLIKRSELSEQGRDYTSFFDSEGTLDEEALIAWLGGLSTRLMGDDVA